MKSRNTQEDRGKTRSFPSGRTLKITILIVILIVPAVLFMCRSIGNRSLSDQIDDTIVGEEGKVNTVTAASILEVLDISELSTAEYVYNSIARAYGEDNSTIRYYVAYEGTITAGIDFNAVQVTVDEEAKSILIALPEITIQDITVNPGSLEYIFVDKKSETEDILKEAFELCQEDLEEKASNEEDLLLLARENAEAVVTALIKPWIMQIDSQFSINVE